MVHREPPKEQFILSRLPLGDIERRAARVEDCMNNGARGKVCANGLRMERT